MNFFYNTIPYSKLFIFIKSFPLTLSTICITFHKFIPPTSIRQVYLVNALTASSRPWGPCVYHWSLHSVKNLLYLVLLLNNHCSQPLLYSVKENFLSDTNKQRGNQCLTDLYTIVKVCKTFPTKSNFVQPSPP